MEYILEIIIGLIIIAIAGIFSRVCFRKKPEPDLQETPLEEEINSNYDVDVLTITTTNKDLTPTDKRHLINATLDQIERKLRQYTTYLAQSGLDVPSKIYVSAIVVLREDLIAPLVALHIKDEKLDISAMDDEELMALYEAAKAEEEIYNSFEASKTVTKVVLNKITE